MDIFVYSDESGVFDNVHNKYFCFGGVICLGKSQRDAYTRKYKHFEDTIRAHRSYGKNVELKATLLSPKDKGKAYRSLNGVYKFCVVIDESVVNQNVFENKKHKQRFQDYSYKMGLKRCLESMIGHGMFAPGDIKNIYVYADEHQTATDGLYELKESLLNEFKYGTINYERNTVFPPLFPNLDGLVLEYCHSEQKILIRAADIIANHVFYQVRTNGGKISENKNLFVFYAPSWKSKAPTWTIETKTN